MFANSSCFGVDFRCESGGRVFYAIEAKAFGTQDKTEYKNIDSAKRKKLKMCKNRQQKVVRNSTNIWLSDTKPVL